MTDLYKNEPNCEMHLIKRRILLLDAYDAPSHQYWRKGLVEYLVEYEWTVLTLPPRFFRWRIRGNGLTWGKGDFAELDQAYDVIIATSMVDLTTLRGFKPHLGLIPTLVYFHENQFVYPEQFTGPDKKVESIDPQIVNLYSALAADHIAFNSHFNRTSFIDGARRLLKKLPDAVPKGLVDELEQKSAVLPVPIKGDVFIDRKSPVKSEPVVITWAARWEYDKGPDRLLAILDELENREIDYRICILGESFRNTPQEFNTIKTRFQHRILQFGYVESKGEYKKILSASDIILSTALHEFQGLSVIEAVTLGCIPVLPKRQVYPELFGHDYVYNTHNNIQDEAKAAVDLIEKVASASIPSTERFMWSSLKADYKNTIERLI